MCAECPLVATSRPRVTHFGMSALRPLADIPVPALDPHSWGVRKTLVFGTGRGLYGNHMFCARDGTAQVTGSLVPLWYQYNGSGWASRGEVRSMKPR